MQAIQTMANEMLVNVALGVITLSVLMQRTTFAWESTWPKQRLPRSKVTQPVSS